MDQNKRAPFSRALTILDGAGGTPVTLIVMLMRLLTSFLSRVGVDVLKRLLSLATQLWHELVGTVFLALGAAAVPSAIREWRGPSLNRAMVVSGFLLLMIYFGVTSFLKARKAGRVIHD